MDTLLQMYKKFKYLNRIDANLYGFFMAPTGDVSCQEELAKKIATNIETAKGDQI